MTVSAWNQTVFKKVCVAVLLVVIVAAAALTFWNLNQKQQALAAERDSLIATGTVDAPTVDVSFKVEGQITALLVGEGDRVAQGQEIARLDAAEIDAKLVQAQGAASAAAAQVQEANSAIPMTGDQIDSAISQAQAMVAKAEAGLLDAKQKYDRAQGAYDANVGSASDLDAATNNYNAAQADLQAAQGALAQAQANRGQVDIAQAKYEAAIGQSTQAQGAVQEAQDYLDDTYLLAPMPGLITQKFLEQGSMVNALTPVYEITDLLHTYVKVYIDENKIGRVHTGQLADVTVDAYPGRVFQGKVVLVNDAGDFAVHQALNDQYDHDIRYYEVKVDLPNPDLALKTGMTATVHLLEGH
jgi:HlyD family secretion protein